MENTWEAVEKKQLGSSVPGRNLSVYACHCRVADRG